MNIINYFSQLLGATAAGAGACLLKDTAFSSLCSISTKVGIDSGPGELIQSLVIGIINIMFFVVLFIAIIYTLRAAIKYVRSQGNEKEVGGAKEALKAILMGVGAMFVALVGILLIQTLFKGGQGGEGSLADAINNIYKKFF